MKISTLEKLLEDQLKDIYNAENQLLKALPKMAKAASNEALRSAITSHLEETQTQVERLDKISEIIGAKLSGKKCAAMEGLIEEGKEAIELESSDEIVDLAIVAAAQRVEHYEIAAYGNARTLAEHLGLSDVVSLLSETLDEESAADEKLTSVTQDDILPSISAESSESESEGSSMAAHSKSGGKSSSRSAGK